MYDMYSILLLLVLTYTRLCDMYDMLLRELICGGGACGVYIVKNAKLQVAGSTYRQLYTWKYMICTQHVTAV